MFLWLDYHFLEPDEFARIVGEDEFQRRNGLAFYQQDITELLKLYNFQPMGSSTTAVKEVRVQQMMQVYQLFNGDQFINQEELRKMLLDAFDVKNQSRLMQQPPMPNATMVPGQPNQMGPDGQPPQMPGGTAGPPSPQQPPGPPVPGQGVPNEAQSMAMMLQGAGGAAAPPMPPGPAAMPQ